MNDLTRLLPKLLSANGGNPELATKLAWARAAGPGLRSHAVPLRLEGRSLIVAVADGIWQKQLEHMSAELIYRTNKLLGQSVVGTVVFQIDRSLTIANEEHSRQSRESQAPAPEELLFAARGISDEELRARFIRAAENCIARRDARPEVNPE